MTLDPILPMWLVWCVMVIAIAACFVAYRAWSALLILRIGVILVLTLMLANPVREVEQATTRRPSLLLVTDTSGSMVTADAGDGQTRIAVSTAMVQRMQNELKEWYNITTMGFNDRLLAALPTSAAGDSDFSGLTGLQAQAPKPAAVVFISDGADWRHSDPEQDLARARIVTHTIAVGDARPATNVGVRLEVASPTVFPGQELPMTAIITATPDLRGKRVRLEVDTIDENSRPVALLRRDVDLDSLVRVPLVDTPSGQKGGRLWRARVAAIPGELTNVDNQDFASAQVVDRSMRVLVFEGQPYWDTTFAVRAWRRDRQLDVATAYGLGKRMWRAGNAAPERLNAEALTGVDVVVLGQSIKSLCDPDTAATLRAYIERGGGVIFIGPGKRLDGLGGDLDALAPITADGQTMNVTVTSADTSLPGLLPKDVSFPLRTLSGASLKPQARILLGNRQQPLIASRHVGGGWVCSVQVEGVWSWSVGEQGRETAERFWRQLIRTLTNAPIGNLRAERLRIPVGDEAVVWVQPDSGNMSPIEVTRPDGSIADVPMHEDTIRMRLEQTGLYRVTRAGESLTLVATVEAREQLEIARDDARLRRLATATGGEFFTPDMVDRLISRLRTTRTLAGSIKKPEPLITDHAWFMVMLLLLGLEWFLRRRAGGV